ncbi:MAG: hypothetical protein A3D44_00780 [Candidatus Staskawiczbacteria bacterium RIFCSPHIGHO2_02_FULL_42_22]|uniref:Uncharacterized protein n=1 Tax=Candidatus Staskawiczbacteria bacterium RIFCSPHIGHO2_02_FULL_42_22 TaxID=1802207 RepID=A0A1G2I0X8_9BACT|nr:MAG: hypothetical protein A3D44_00780 [Candidatus Staskawiczbacteria bacterium RIFCSPHIGHO2_02_FULL_42_22]
MEHKTWNKTTTSCYVFYVMCYVIFILLQIPKNSRSEFARKKPRFGETWLKKNGVAGLKPAYTLVKARPRGTTSSGL